MTETDKINSYAFKITKNEVNPIRYSICTLVSKHWEYLEMIESFKKAGFEESFTEFLYIDNSTNNEFDAYQGLNKFLLRAKGQYIILCHQDILLEYDNIVNLEKCIDDLNKLDENWAILSNAGGAGIKDVVYRLTGPDKKYKKRGQPIQRVSSVDENFILVKKNANLSLSHNLNGFHLYGTDLCIIADVLGFNSYVVEFNILHKSKGNLDPEFFKIKEKLIEKYSVVFSSRYIQTTCTSFYLSGNKIIKYLFNSKIAFFIVRNFVSLTSKYRKNIKITPKSEW